jgi:hypothetical protein
MFLEVVSCLGNLALNLVGADLRFLEIFASISYFSQHAGISALGAKNSGGPDIPPSGPEFPPLWPEFLPLLMILIRHRWIISRVFLPF